MRYSRFRLRISLLFSLATLFFYFTFTLFTLIRSSTDLDSPENVIHKLNTFQDSTFWFARNQSNIYNVNSIQTIVPNSRTIIITSERIEELFLLIKNNQSKQTISSTKQNSSITNSTWIIKKLFNQNIHTNSNDTNTHVDTIDSARINVTNAKSLSNITTTEINISEDDKIQLRDIVVHALNKWKQTHKNDKQISLGDILHDGLAEDEPIKLNTTWFEYMKMVTNYRLYDQKSEIFKRLLNDLQYTKINEANEMAQGTQIKLVLNFPGGFQGLVKPYRVPRDYQTHPDHFYFSDIERHHAEIGAFHVDKVLGFNRVPPLIGRLFNITSDLYAKATEELAKTFFISPANNTCFRGHCSYYCDTSHAVCGRPGDHLEGSVQLLLPRPPEIIWQKITHPYRRSYSATRTVEWEKNENYCYEHVLIDEDYHNRLLLDMMDLSAFDFLIGNMDRHHMMRIRSFGENTALVHLDNGRAFGRHDHDELSILAPIRQCCLFRYSTFIRLYNVYHQGLSQLVSNSLKAGEKLSNILIDQHLQAIDRRLEILFAHIDKCIRTYSVKRVIIDDGVT